MRDPDLQHLIDSTKAAFEARMSAPSPITVLAQKFFAAAAEETGDLAEHDELETLPVCQHLAPALVTAATGSKQTAAVAEAFSRLSPRLSWNQRPKGPRDAANFSGNHANTTLVGHGGLEVRDDIRIGASLIAPGITYPDHDHPPEEMYLVLSDGEWRNGETDWHAPGIGGTVHNPPGIVHAMRSSDKPLFAIWCLLSE